MFFLREGSLQTIPEGVGNGGGCLEEKGRGHSQTKLQHTITGTTDITDTAEGAGMGLQTGPPSTPGRDRQGCGGRERAGEEEEGWVSPWTPWL